MPGGRPTAYKDEYAEQVYKLCLLGADDKKIADFFDVCEKTINTWKHEHPEFLQSIRRGKDIADMEVAKSLYHRAKGYSHPEEKIFQNGGEVIRVDTIKHYPPEVKACENWLNNRQKAYWRSRQEVDLGGSSLSINIIERKKDQDDGNGE